MLGCYSCLEKKRSSIVCHIPSIEQISNCKGFSGNFYRKIISWLISIEILIKANPYYPNKHNRYCWKWVLKVVGGHSPMPKCGCAHQMVTNSPSRSGAQHKNSGAAGPQRAVGGEAEALLHCTCQHREKTLLLLPTKPKPKPLPV